MEEKEIRKDATFSKEELSRIKRARTLIERVIYNSRHANRDTEMLGQAVDEIGKVIDYQLVQYPQKGGKLDK